MSDDQFTKLFKYMEEFRQEVRERFDKMEARIDHLVSTIDAFVKRLDDFEVGQAARNRQFARLVDWAHKVSKKTGIPLENL